MLNCHWKMAREVGADFTCPCPGHCETWLIHQKLTACRSHLLSHAIHVCKRTKWKLQKKMLLLGLEAKRNSGFCKDWLYTKKRDTKFCSTEALFDSLEGLLCVHWIALSYIQLIVTHCNHTMRKKNQSFPMHLWKWTAAGTTLLEYDVSSPTQNWPNFREHQRGSWADIFNYLLIFLYVFLCTYRKTGRKGTQIPTKDTQHSSKIKLLFLDISFLPTPDDWKVHAPFSPPALSPLLSLLHAVWRTGFMPD